MTSSSELVALFERTMDGLWQRTLITLGEVTLLAIADRVLYTACERHPVCLCLEPQPSGIGFERLRGRVDEVNRDELTQAMEFVLLEFLSVLGVLTAQILTPALHAELTRAAFDGEASTSTQAPESLPRLLNLVKK